MSSIIKTKICIPYSIHSSNGRSPTWPSSSLLAKVVGLKLTLEVQQGQVATWHPVELPGLSVTASIIQVTRALYHFLPPTLMRRWFMFWNINVFLVLPAVPFGCTHWTVPVPQCRADHSHLSIIILVSSFAIATLFLLELLNICEGGGDPISLSMPMVPE